VIAALSVLSPIFSIVVLGWLCARIGLFDRLATGVLNRFVIQLALPSLLFDIIVRTSWQALWQPAFLVSFGGGSLVAFALAFSIALASGHSSGEGAVDGLNAGYPNVGFLGFPICAAALGPQTRPMVLLASLFTACLLFPCALAIADLDATDRAAPRSLLRLIGGFLIRNPIIIAPVAAALCKTQPLGRFGHATDAVAATLGAAAVPTALFAVGLFVHQELGLEPDGEAGTGWVGGSLLKLLFQPLATLTIALLMKLPNLPMLTAILLAALPTGTGGLMLAVRYGRRRARTARLMLATTCASFATLATWLTFAPR
jgi:predicted permease